MNEKALSQELHRVADAVPVPDDLIPADLASRRPRANSRPRWLGAAVAAAVLLVFLATPLGARVVTAAGELIMQYTVKLVRTEQPAQAVPYIDAGSVLPGQTVTKELPNAMRQVAEGFHLRELEPGWPLPAYRAPGPDARVVRVSTYREEKLQTTGINISWQDGGKTLFYSLTRRVEPLSEAALEQLRSSKGGQVLYYTNDQKARVEQKSVVLKGQPALATKVGPNWSLYWYSEDLGGSISGNVELDDLVKIAESLPDLQ